MVWGLFPADPHSGELKYYIFSKGTYKVGRKDCDVIITKDKGVSRVHAHIVVDDIISLNDPLDSRVRVRDCSKYGTFINKNISSKEQKIHELPNKEASLKDHDLVSFGTGNATYRFCFVPLLFLVYCSDSFQSINLIREKVSSIGASITYHFTEECTHILADELMPVGEAVLDAVVAEKPVVLWSWVELIAEQSIRSEIPSWNSYVPTLTLEGVPVKIADSGTRAKCLEGYTCLLLSIDLYKFRDRLQSILEVGGAKIIFADELCSGSQGFGSRDNSRRLGVIPNGSTSKFDCFSKLDSLYRVNELDLLCGVLSGQRQSSTLISISAPVSSSCSTDETIVADSDIEAEIATSSHAVETAKSVHAAEPARSFHATANICSNEPPDHINKPERSMVHLPSSSSEDGHVKRSRAYNDGMTSRSEKIDDSASGNSDIFYTQELIVRDLQLPSSINSATNSGVLNFKRFKKQNGQSGNSFNNLIPFAKYPYKDSDFRNEEMLESMKEEKRQKQMEAIAEDLFNNEKARRRGVAGSLRGLLLVSNEGKKK